MEAHDFTNFLNRIIFYDTLHIEYTLVGNGSVSKMVCVRHTAYTLYDDRQVPKIRLLIMALKYKLKTSLRFGYKLNIYIAFRINMVSCVCAWMGARLFR